MPEGQSYPDTYFYFVTGYMVLWVVLFVAVGCILRKLSKLEKQ